MYHRRRLRRSFALTELIIALVLCSTVLTICWSVYSTFLASTTKAEQHAYAQQRYWSAIRRLRSLMRTINALGPRAIFCTNDDATPPSLLFTSLTTTNTSSPDEAGACLSMLHVDPHQGLMLTRHQQSLREKESSPASWPQDYSILLWDNVSSISWRILTYHPETHSITWQASWPYDETRKEVPIALEATVSETVSGALRRTVITECLEEHLQKNIVLGAP